MNNPIKICSHGNVQGGCLQCEIAASNNRMESAPPRHSRARLELENAVLWAWVKCVYLEDECRCGNPPYTDGNPCPKCMALELMEKWGKKKPNE